MNILIISGYSHASIGGAEKYIREVIKIGKKNKINFFEISLLQNYKNAADKMCDSVLLSNKFTSKNNENIFHKLIEYYFKNKAVNKYLKNNKIDLILLNGVDFSLKKKYLNKAIFIQHSDNQYYEKLKNKFYFKYLGINTISAKAKNIVCFSKQSKDRFEKIEKYNMNRNYFIVPMFLQEPNNCINKQENIVYVGRLSDEKGIQSIIELSNIINEKIHVYGDGPIRLTNYENIIYHGFLNPLHLEEAFGNAKLNILLSKSEGLPFSIIEGFSYGIPCIIIDSFINAKFLVNNGKNGILLNRDTDINQIANIVNNFDYKNFSGKEIKSFAKDNFNYLDFEKNWIYIFSKFK